MSNDILDGTWIFPFGKHKFSKLKDVPPAYLVGLHGNITYSVVYADLMRFIAANLVLLKAGISPFEPTYVENTRPCTKYQYASEEEAKKHLREIRKSLNNPHNTNKKIPNRAYKCEVCPFWHLTSRPERFVSK